MTHWLELRDIAGPWVFRASNEICLEKIYGSTKIIEADGNNMRNLADFYKEISKAFSLPEYSGHNLNALFDSLTDLIWITDAGVLFIVWNSGSMLIDETSEAVEGVKYTLERVGSEWAKFVNSGYEWDRNSISFNTLLIFDGVKVRKEYMPIKLLG